MQRQLLAPARYVGTPPHGGLCYLGHRAGVPRPLAPSDRDNHEKPVSSLSHHFVSDRENHEKPVNGPSLNVHARLAGAISPISQTGLADAIFFHLPGWAGRRKKPRSKSLSWADLVAIASRRRRLPWNTGGDYLNLGIVRYSGMKAGALD